MALTSINSASSSASFGSWGRMVTGSFTRFLPFPRPFLHFLTGSWEDFSISGEARQSRNKSKLELSTPSIMEPTQVAAA